MRELIQVLAEAVSGNPVLNYLADTCVTISVVILFLILIRPLMKKLPRLGMYVLWFAVVIRILCPFSFRGIYAVFPEQWEQAVAQTSSWICVENFVNWFQDEKEAGGGPSNGYRLSEKAKELLKEKRVQREEPLSAGSLSVKPAKAEPKSGSAFVSGANTSVVRLGEQTGKEKKNPLAAWLLGVWGLGVAVCVIYTAGSLVWVRVRVRNALQIEKGVYVLDGIQGAFVSGIFSPGIYISPYLTGEERNYILSHERVHIRRRDYLLKPFTFCVFAIFWFNPLVWTAWHLMMRDMEVSCDESVVRELEADARKSYSYLLLAMSEGRGLPEQIPAFSAGAVKERIQGIMHYKKPTAFVTAVVIAAVGLCGCAVASEPEQTEKMPERSKKESVYIEEKLELVRGGDWGDYLAVPGTEYIMSPEGKLVYFRTLYSDEEKTKKRDITYVKVDAATGEAQQPAWLDAYKKRFPGQNYELERYRYGADGKLYLYVVEYTMNKRVYYAQALTLKNEFEAVHHYLMRVDETSGTMTEINLPEENVMGVYGENVPKGVVPGVARVDFDVTADGNLLIVSEGSQTGGIYQGVTGEKLGEVDFANRISEIRAGDDFWIYASLDYKSNKIEVNVLNEDGIKTQTILTDVVREDTGKRPLVLGTRENTILMACDEGIYEMEFGEKEFHTVAEVRTSNIYYLGTDNLEANGVYKEGDVYFVSLLEYLTDGEYAEGYGLDAWDNTMMCQYAKIDDEKEGN